MTQLLSTEGTKCDAPFADGLVADLNAALVQSFLDILVANPEAVVPLHRVLNKRQRETMEVRIRVTDGQPPPTRLRQHELCGG